MNERLSAWMDGELDDRQARHLQSQLKDDAEMRSDWNHYHLIGDTLRGAPGPELHARICARLASEPTILAPPRFRMAESPRWQVAASIAAFVLFGGIWMTLPQTQQDAPKIVHIPAPEANRSPVPAGVGAKAYLLAHLRYVPGNALQALSSLTRSAEALRIADATEELPSGSK